MRFYKTTNKHKVPDELWSKIIRFGRDRCEKCEKVRELQAAHIISRRFLATRWMLAPIRNGIALCAKCHDWFDSHKIRDVIFSPDKQVFKDQESYSFLVWKLEYSWEELKFLWMKAQASGPMYEFQKSDLTKQLRQELRQLERAAA